MLYFIYIFDLFLFSKYFPFDQNKISNFRRNEKTEDFFIKKMDDELYDEFGNYIGPELDDEYTAQETFNEQTEKVEDRMEEESNAMELVSGEQIFILNLY